MRRRAHAQTHTHANRDTASAGHRARGSMGPRASGARGRDGSRRPARRASSTRAVRGAQRSGSPPPGGSMLEACSISFLLAARRCFSSMTFMPRPRPPPRRPGARTFGGAGPRVPPTAPCGAVRPCPAQQITPAAGHRRNRRTLRTMIDGFPKVLQCVWFNAIPTADDDKFVW